MKEMIPVAQLELLDGSWRQRLTTILETEAAKWSEDSKGGIQSFVGGLPDIQSCKEMCLELTTPFNYYQLGAKHYDLGLTLLGVTSLKDYTCSCCQCRCERCEALKDLCYGTGRGHELVKANPRLPGGSYGDKVEALKVFVRNGDVAQLKLHLDLFTVPEERQYWSVEICDVLLKNVDPYLEDYTWLTDECLKQGNHEMLIYLLGKDCCVKQLMRAGLEDVLEAASRQGWKK